MTRIAHRNDQGGKERASHITPQHLCRAAYWQLMADNKGDNLSQSGLFFIL
jgi:hypothetical protein